MKHLLAGLVALAAIALVAPTADAGKKLKIKKPKPVAVGLTWTVKESITFDMQVATKGGAMPLQGTESVDATVEVMEAADDQIERLRIVYGTTGDARSGKTYLVEAGSSGPVITDSTGATVAKDELDDVMKSHGDAIRRTPLRSWLVGKSFRKGKAVKVGSDALVDLFGPEADYTVDKMTITLARSTKKVAVFRFAATFTMRGSEDGNTFEMHGDATGTFEIDLVRVLPRSVDATMSLSGAFVANGERMSISGTYVASRRIEYQ